MSLRFADFQSFRLKKLIRFWDHKLFQKMMQLQFNLKACMFFFTIVGLVI